MSLFRKNLILLLFIALFINDASAQFKARFGLRAGLSLPTVMGEFETDTAGIALERHRMSAKLLVGPTVDLSFHKNFGLATELLFVQKGSLYRFEAEDSYLKMPALNQTFEGHKRIFVVNQTNGYIEIPVLFYARMFNRKLRIEAGPSIGFLISSRGLGTLKYEDENHPNDLVEFNLDFRYLRDSVGQIPAVGNSTSSGKIDGTTVLHPTTVGAYYFNETKQGTYFNIIDAGINFGLSYYVSGGLQIGARGYYGFTDITNDHYNFSQVSLDNDKNYIPRTDRDININVQLFIALQFN